MMALRRDLMIHQGDCGQAKRASSRASVVPSAHVKWLGGGREGRAGGHLAWWTTIAREDWLGGVWMMHLMIWNNDDTVMTALGGKRWTCSMPLLQAARETTHAYPYVSKALSSTHRNYSIVSPRSSICRRAPHSHPLFSLALPRANHHPPGEVLPEARAVQRQRDKGRVVCSCLLSAADGTKLSYYERCTLHMLLAAAAASTTHLLSRHTKPSSPPSTTTTSTSPCVSLISILSLPLHHRSRRHTYLNTATTTPRPTPNTARSLRHCETQW